jgi:hypothetical protein
MLLRVALHTRSQLHDHGRTHVRARPRAYTKLPLFVPEVMNSVELALRLPF